MDSGLRRLRYFGVLAVELNFGRAAKRLNITQPALSRAIARLEDDVGMRLFARTNRRVALTPAGRSFAAGCERTLGSLDEAIDAARRIDSGEDGTLTIGYTDTAIAGCLPDIVEGFSKVAPGVVIRLVQAFTARQVAMLDDGQLDVAMMTGPATRPGTEALRVQSDRFMALLPAGNDLARKARIRLTDLAEQPCVSGDPERWTAYNAQLTAHCDRAGFRQRIVQTAPESRAIVGLVSCGLGIAILPEAFVATVDHRVAVREIEGLDARLETVACWRPADAHPALLRFARHLRDCYGDP